MLLKARSTAMHGLINIKQFSFDFLLFVQPRKADTAVLNSHPEFVIDNDIGNKLLIDVAPDGYLKRTKL